MEEFFLGARLTDQGAFFKVWAPQASEVHLVLPDTERKLALSPEKDGYYTLLASSIEAGTNYMYSLDNGPLRPDPVSRYQPEGVHGPSQLIDHRFPWTDTEWHPPALYDSIIYELHVGTFSSEGTFSALQEHLPYLKELGITTIQLMPVAQFPGARNWGYDGVQLFAPHNTYGGPNALKRLVNACHQHGLAVFLDVVYNHLGPEGNYLWDFGPYFTDRYKTPWGSSVNLDGPDSDQVRTFFIENAIYWLNECHLDGLRLDATHALFDFSARPFLAELSTRVHSWASQANRSVSLIAENDQNDRRLTFPVDAFGLGMDGQWNDDFHHALHVSLTNETDGYYADYQATDTMYRVLQEGFAYTGQYSPTRKKQHGTSISDLPTDRFVVSTQTHDQVGNRMMGERLSALTSSEGLKLAACVLTTSPYTPMLFMGEEYGDMAPFLYFVSHSDNALIEAIQKGRAAEFAGFAWLGTPPDPQSKSTFTRCKLNHHLKQQGDHALLFELYKELIQLRKTTKALTNPNRSEIMVTTGDHAKMICMERKSPKETVRVLMNFDSHNTGHFSFASAQNTWHKVMDSRAPRWTIDKNLPTALFPQSIEALSTQSLIFSPLSFAIYITAQPA